MTLTQLRQHIPVFTEYIDADIMLRGCHALDEIAVKVDELHRELIDVLRECRKGQLVTADDVEIVGEVDGATT